MSTEVRPIKETEIREWMNANATGFGEHHDEDEMESRLARLVLDRTLGIFEHNRIVGTAGSFMLDMQVPGNTLPVGCISSVTVMPTHRRRGMLTRMMDYQLKDLHDREEPLSGLYASEGLIYRRFGFGIATQGYVCTVRQHATLAHRPEPTGQIKFISPDEAWNVFPPIFDRIWRNRQGMMSRDNRRWHRRLYEKNRSYFHAVYQAGNSQDGYVLYRIDQKESKVDIYELIAATDEAYGELWSFCLGIDNMKTTSVAGPPPQAGRPFDDPLPWMLADPRDISRRPIDGIWLKLVDVRSALSNRIYSADGSLIIEVHDPFCEWNEGRWTIDGGIEGARCETTRAKPNLIMDVSDLASIYLGGVKVRTLVEAGRIEAKDTKSVILADAMFSTEHEPWCAEEF